MPVGNQEKFVIDISEHDRLLKEAGLTPRENALMAYRHECPMLSLASL
jgi:hypothetical protein